MKTAPDRTDGLGVTISEPRVTRFRPTQAWTAGDSTGKPVGTLSEKRTVSMNVKKPITMSTPWLDLIIVAVYSALSWTPLLQGEPIRDVGLLFQYAAKLGQEKLGVLRAPCYVCILYFALSGSKPNR